MKIGVLTGGGDVPGLNMAIHDITKRASMESDVQVVGIRRGWGGLIYRDPNRKEFDSNHTIMLNPDIVRKIDRKGGTVLHTSRINPIKVKCEKDLIEFRGLDFQGTRDMTEDVLANLRNLGIDFLVAIGGDDTLSYALHLHKKGFPIIAIPKTIDGDVMGTDYTLGFSTAISRADHYITELRVPIGSHERIGVLEIFGRDSGCLAFCAALAAKVDRLVIPEVDLDVGMDRLVELLIKDRNKSPSRYSVVLVSEGATIGGKKIYQNDLSDAYGHKRLGGVGNVIAQRIERAGVDTMSVSLTYLLRGGAPDAKDKIVASGFANMVFNAILRSESGKMAAIREGKHCMVPLEETAGSPKKVDLSLYDSERYTPNYKGLEGSLVFL